MLEGASCGTQRQARCRRRAPRRRGEGFRGEAPWLQFTNSIDAALDLPMHEKNTSPENDGTECTNKPERWVRVDGRRDQPADQGDFRRDHYPEPEPEIDELLPEAIEFGVPDFPDNMTFSGGRRGADENDFSDCVSSRCRLLRRCVRSRQV